MLVNADVYLTVLRNIFVPLLTGYGRHSDRQILFSKRQHQIYTNNGKSQAFYKVYVGKFLPNFEEELSWPQIAPSLKPFLTILYLIT
jgi:hypothetical protein